MQVLFLPEIINLLLHVLDGGIGPQAFQLRVVTALGGEIEAGFVLLVLARHVGTQGDFCRAVAPVMAEQHDLTAVVNAADALGLEICGTYPVDIDFNVIHGLVGELGSGVKNLPGDVIAVGDADGKAVAGIGHGGKHGPVGAVTHDKSEQTNVVVFQQVDKIFLLGFAHVGHTVGDQHDAGGAVCVQWVQGQAQAAEQVGTSPRLELHDLFRVLANIVRGGVYKATGEFFGTVIKQHDTEAIAAAQFAQCLADAVAQGGQFGAHGAGNIQYEHPVATGGDRGQIITGGDAEHEGATVLARCLVGHQIHAAGKVLLVAPVDHDVLVQGEGIGRLAVGSRWCEVGVLAVCFFFTAGGGRAVVQCYLPLLWAQLLDLCLGMFGQPQCIHRVAAAQVQGKTEVFFNAVVGGPEGQLLLVHAAFLQRVHITADAGIHGGRLHVDQPHPGILTGAHRLHLHIKRLVAVFLGEPGFTAGGFFLLVYLAGLLFFQHFTDHRFVVDPYGEFGHGAFFGNRKAVVGFQVLIIGVVEHLLDFGDGIAVFHIHSDMLFADL